MLALLKLRTQVHEVAVLLLHLADSFRMSRDGLPQVLLFQVEQSAQIGYLQLRLNLLRL